MGIDVSHYQGKIDWHTVEQSHGFAFAKATQGTGITDPMFTVNWAGMKSSGILRGAYHFFLCQEDPTQQALHFCHALQSAGYEDADLPPVLDLEDRPGAVAIGGSQMIDNVHTFFGVVKQELGRKPVLYCDYSFYGQYNLESQFMPYVYLWIARYGVSNPGVSDFSFWQYSQIGTVEGIEGMVDLDSFNGAGIEGLKQLISESKIS
jgi:lysozyme